MKNHVARRFPMTLSFLKAAAVAATLAVAGAIGSAHAVTLSVSPTPVGGRVTSSPGSINCGGNPSPGAVCSNNFTAGVSVSLTATADAGFAFVNWTGSLGTSTANPLVSPMPPSNISVTANFAPLYALSVNFSGSTGSGGVSTSSVGTQGAIACGTDLAFGFVCSSSYASGRSIILTTTTSPGSVFGGWGGACAAFGTAASCTVVMDSAKSVTAVFTANTLAVARSGAGSGTVTSSPAGINCGSTCSASFNGGTGVTLSASPAAGSVFTGWSGACSGFSCSLTMNGPASVTATFLPLYDLTASTAGSGEGSVSSSPAGIGCSSSCTASFMSGTIVNLTASPAAGSSFTGWSGACSGGANPCTTTMSAAKSVVATFTDPRALVTRRAGHTATLLHNGKILIVGGSLLPNTPLALETYLASTELYDPATGISAPTGNLATARAGHTATMLSNGRVLVAGGANGTTVAAQLSSAELYDPATGSWSPAGNMTAARSGHTATLLGPGLAPARGNQGSGSGQVLAAGGVVRSGASSTYLATTETYDPATNSWTAAGPMIAARTGHTASIVGLGGDVIVVGGRNAGGKLNGVERFNPGTRTWSPIASLATARSEHTSMLSTANLLTVIGGNGTSGPTGTVEVLNLASGAWASANPLVYARAQHSAALLPSGDIVVIGGVGPGGDSIALAPEKIDPTAGLWAPAGPAGVARSGHTSTLLPWGRVVITGGLGAGTTALATVEQASYSNGQWASPASMAMAWASRGHAAVLTESGSSVMIIGGYAQTTPGVWAANRNCTAFDPVANTGTGPNMMISPRLHHTATRLPNGWVLVVGGEDNFELTNELYSPTENKWYSSSNLVHRSGHTATMLADGRVLIAGGFGSTQAATNAQIYDYASGVTDLGPMPSLRRHHTATLLMDGRILLAGGNNGASTVATAEAFSQNMDSLTLSDVGSLATAREGHTATLLHNGKVLVAGGGTATAELFDPATNSWSAAAPMASIRSNHTATLLPDGRVLVTGGFNGSYLNSAEIYDPWRDAWSSAGTMSAARSEHTATLVADGSVLLVGGWNGTAPETAPERFQLYPQLLAGSRPLLTVFQLQSGGTGDVVMADPGRTLDLGALGGGPYYSVLEGGGGGGNASAANFPVVQVTHLDSGMTRWLPLVSGDRFSDYGINVSALADAGLPYGPALVTVHVGGVPSSSVQLVQMPDVTLTYSVPGLGSAGGTITIDRDGECGPHCALVGYRSNATLIANPQTGSDFLSWGGMCTGTDTLCMTPRLDRNRTVIAEFKLQNRGVTIDVPIGPGAIFAGTMNCGVGSGASTTPASCSASVEYGTIVNFAANPVAGFIFHHWSGDCAGTVGPICSVTVTNDVVVGAVFYPAIGVLIVSKTGTGAGSVASAPAGVDCGATCSANFSGGTVVTLTATPSAGSVFAGWSGAGCSGTGTCQALMDQNQFATATFDPIPGFALTVAKSGSGGGTVSSSPAGIDCGATCTNGFANGTSVLLIATPNASSSFTSWTGCDSVASNQCTVVVNAARNVSVTFNATPVNYTLTVVPNGTGAGTVTSNPGAINCGATCSDSYAAATVVTLTATPVAGSTFANWTNCPAPSANTCSVTMGASTLVTATFNLATAGNPAKPDFNADGKPDIIWSNTANGATYVWRMNGPALLSDSFYATIDPSWKIQGVADFNGDGHPDIVWRNTANGACYVWYTVNGVFTGTDAFLFSLPPEWVIQGVADFNADGKPDFLMRNVNSGNAFAWFFNDNLPIGDQFLFNVDPSWKVEAVGDVNLDGQPDLLFRSTTSGLSFAWYTQYAGSVLSLGGSSPMIYSIDPVWEVVQLADWNGDGKPDLLFRNAATGLVFVWYLDGVTLGASDYVIQIDPSWEIVPRR
ncbi:MAG: VCBS repeat-containing protein [Betaproteobacteria bacterium]|nr:VCBS repeat-containing protein [Betaproteobacteria bacterium]